LTLPRVYLLLTTLMWSTIDRVVGTAFRHRSEILASLVILAATSRPMIRQGAGVEEAMDAKRRAASS
jgi:hypothetical protein